MCDPWLFLANPESGLWLVYLVIFLPSLMWLVVLEVLQSVLWDTFSPSHTHWDDSFAPLYNGLAQYTVIAVSVPVTYLAALVSLNLLKME